MSHPHAAADPSQIVVDDVASQHAASGSGDQRSTVDFESDPDPAAVELSDQLISFARSAAVEEAGSAELVGGCAGAVADDEVAVSVAFAAGDRGYRGWYWSVTMALVDAADPTVSEVVLLPGQQALLPPPWVPWDQRIRAGDVGAGDLLPTAPDDVRLVPGYVDSDDPAVKEVAYEVGFGRVRVLSREGRDDAAQRWHDGPFGPDSAVAASAQANCVTCGFYVPLAGLLGTALGACSNEFSPADGRVVDADFGCGAHSDTVIDAPLISASTDTVVDELMLEVHRRPAPVRADAQVAPAVLDPALEAEPDLLADVVLDPVPESVLDAGTVEQDLVEQDLVERDSAESGGDVSGPVESPPDVPWPDVPRPDAFRPDVPWPDVSWPDESAPAP